MPGDNMIYNAGTVSISGNMATGTGTNWTAPASQIRTGQTIIVLSNPVQLFQITAINSATSLAVTPAASPTLSGQKYGILVTDSLSVDGLAQSISQLINEYDENIGAWESFASTTANQNVTVTINGVSLSIPALGKLVQKGTNGAVSVSQGGTGATTAADARSNLGLGNSATRDVGTGAGNLMETGAFGLGAINPPFLSAGALLDKTGWAAARANEAFPTPTGPFMCLTMRYDENSAVFHAIDAGTSAPQHYFRVRAGGLSGWYKYWTTVNTTKASDGTLKAASPVARVIKSQEETGRTDACEEGFTWCGCGTANAEAEGISISRIDVGVYVLAGAAGLASEGWQLLPPMDPGGMGELGMVEAEETESGGIIIRLFKRRYMMGEDGGIVKTKGVPMDVPANSWIDVRLDMPADSLFNQRNQRTPEVSALNPSRGFSEL